MVDNVVFGKDKREREQLSKFVRNPRCSVNIYKIPQRSSTAQAILPQATEADSEYSETPIFSST